MGTFQKKVLRKVGKFQKELSTAISRSKHFPEHFLKQFLKQFPEKNL